MYAEGCENIALKGGGKIKGNGHLFGLKPVASENNTTPPKYIDVIEMRQDYRSQLRFAHPSKYGGPIYFKNCKNITVDNFIIECLDNNYTDIKKYSPMCLNFKELYYFYYLNYSDFKIVIDPCAQQIKDINFSFVLSNKLIKYIYSIRK